VSIVVLATAIYLVCHRVVDLETPWVDTPQRSLGALVGRVNAPPGQ
ncbi:MAG: hypothetical protein ACYCOU_25235, partial [Sulfobacillus sp.]